MQLTIVIKTMYGLEQALSEELAELGFNEVVLLNRAVELKGDWKDVYRLNYWCRLAISVLVKVDEFDIRHEDELYKKAKLIDWTNYFDVSKTFAVKGAVHSDFFKHTQFPMLLVKDAIADVFRDKTGERPNVNVKSPQVMFDVHISNKKVTISLNTSGLPLYQRGYRQGTGEAPLNEVLAAGLIRLSGWDKKSTFIDPMCGSGTLVIEAALMAANIPPMIERQHFAFKNFKGFDADIWEEIKADGNHRPVKLGFDIIGYDSDATVLQKARRNARTAPIGNMIHFDVLEMKDLKIEASRGTLICNPPYGERIGDEIVELYQMMGDIFKNQLHGFDCWVISSNVDALKHLGLRPERKIKLFNGSLECSFRKFSIYAGSKKSKEETGYGELESEQLEVKDEVPHYEAEEKKLKSVAKKRPVDTPKPTVQLFARKNTGSKYQKASSSDEGYPSSEEKPRSEPQREREAYKKTEKSEQNEQTEAKASKYAPRIESTKDKIERMKKRK
jgi:23S rRNA G2445 N2-methylase RlmL